MIESIRIAQSNVYVQDIQPKKGNVMIVKEKTLVSGVLHSGELYEVIGYLDDDTEEFDGYDILVNGNRIILTLGEERINESECLEEPIVVRFIRENADIVVTNFAYQSVSIIRRVNDDRL